jgi:Fe-S-cluster-containing dehydrogenase component
MACQVAHDLPDDQWWQFIRTKGGGAGIDEPAGVFPNLRMSWMPIYTLDCTLCGDRQENGSEPYCSYNCPTKAMTFGNLDDPQSPITVRMNQLKEKGYRIFQIPAWERARPEIYYAEK